MKKVKFYDLTQPIYHNCPSFPTYAPVVVNQDYRSVLNGFNAETVTFSTHTVTHIDTPYHLYDDGETVDKVPLDRFAGPGVFIDLRPMEPDAVIGVQQLQPHLSKIEPGDVVLLNTGWWQKRGFNKEYLYQFPYVDEAGAKLLADAGAKAVGLDSISIGGWGSREKARPAHEVLLSRGIIVIETVRFPEEIMDGRKHFVSAFPLLLLGAGGCPARVVAYDFE
jgi:kynurenine formamidase